MERRAENAAAAAAKVPVVIAAAVAFAQRAFAAVGVPERDARRAAAAIVDADVHGVSTHGLKNLRGYITAVREGRVNARPQPRMVGGGPAMKVMTGDHGLGHVVAYAGMDTAIAAAREYGVGMVFMRESSHYGASGYWARLALRHNMAGFAVTNAGPSIAPWGGREPLLGNNPPAWAIPARVRPTADDRPRTSDGRPGTADEVLEDDVVGGPGDAVFLDMALSVAAGNKFDLYRKRGLPIPPGWALDRDGLPTSDPQARAHGGSLVPVAEYKGYGLTLVLSLMTSLLSGGPFDYDVNRTDPPQPRGRCHWFAAYDIRQVVPLEAFTARAREICARVRESPPREGVDRIYVPGDIELEHARRARAEGIPLDRFIVDDLRQLGAELKIEGLGTRHAG